MAKIINGIIYYPQTLLRAVNCEICGKTINHKLSYAINSKNSDNHICEKCMQQVQLNNAKEMNANKFEFPFSETIYVGDFNHHNCTSKQKSSKSVVARFYTGKKPFEIQLEQCTIFY